MDPVLQELLKMSTCEIREDPITRRAYSVDASIYEMEPSAVIIPRTSVDVSIILQHAFQHHRSVVPRGAATGITGGCLGSGWIIDTSKYLNKILKINYEKEYAIVEPGVIQDSLNKALELNGYRLGPDTSTGNRATLGGMVANNAAGARSLRFGQMVDHVQEVEIVLINGETLVFNAVDDEMLKVKSALNTREGAIYRTIEQIRAEYGPEIALRFPHIPRRVSGYNLNELIKPGPLNVCKLITGSEGTLGILTKIKVGICKKPKFSALCIVHFTELLKAMQAVPDMLSFAPLSLELIDDHILRAGLRLPTMRGKLDWLEGDPQAILVAEFDADAAHEAEEKCLLFSQSMRQRGIGYAWPCITDSKSQSNVWELRKAGLGLLLSKRTYSRAIAFIEDLSIDPYKLAPFMETFLPYLKSKGIDAGIYGHAGAGCMHIRPYIDLRSREQLELMRTIMLDVSGMILEFGGALSGEHGDGLIRSWLNHKMFGDRLYHAFEQLKSAFDPGHLMNPNKKVHGPPVEKQLRLNPETVIKKIPTFQDFSEEGGFELAADLCNGNAQCRKTEGVMCPSFQASGDEYDTTRARAQALRAVINSRLPLEDWTGNKLYDVLDLCIECKGCKTECPSSVDMAKMKAEFLYQYQQKNGYLFRNRLFANVDSFFKVASPFARLINWSADRFFSKTLLDWAGITVNRPLPKIALQTFSNQSFAVRNTFEKKVVLFNDTYTEFIEPHIGMDAIKVLNAFGYEVIVPGWTCCGRPHYSKGFLKQAQEAAQKLTGVLSDYARQGLPIIGLEPSCLSMICDDYTGLLKHDNIYWKKLLEIRKKTLSFDEFIASHLHNGHLPSNFKPLNKNILLHGHCHQKSLCGTKSTLDALHALTQSTVSEIASGCCGMAGSFGYEKDHYNFSMKIAELKLLPAIRRAPKALIVADGISCRSQIVHGTGRTALHLAEAFAKALDLK